MMVIVLSVCCNIFNGDEKSDNSEWKKASLPKMLHGDWYVDGIYEMKITSSKMTMNNREWVISEVEKNDDEYRIILKSSIHYRAMYFRNITDTSTEKSMGYITFSSYDAKKAVRGSWITMTKE